MRSKYIYLILIWVCHLCSIANSPLFLDIYLYIQVSCFLLYTISLYLFSFKQLFFYSTVPSLLVKVLEKKLCLIKKVTPSKIRMTYTKLYLKIFSQNVRKMFSTLEKNVTWNFFAATIKYVLGSVRASVLC